MSSSPISTPTRPTLKRSIRHMNSSDTDITPPRKRARSSRDFGEVEKPDCDLCHLLRNRIYDPNDDTAIGDLKSMRKLKREQDVEIVAQDIIRTVKIAVKVDIQSKGQKCLEVELYLMWLEGFNFVFKGVEHNLQTLLATHIPKTRRHVPGLGRLCFSLLYHLIDGFIDEVNAHQDGWSFRFPAGPIEHDPLVMSLAEESNDESTDDRSEDAVQDAEVLLKRYDRIMVAALHRYKKECDKKLTATAIERKEESLSRGCCLLNEQTGYGGTDDIMGFELMVETRDAMTNWIAEAQSRCS